MTIKAAAEAIGVSRPTIYALAKRGELTIIHDGLLKRAPARIPVEDVERCIKKRAATT